LSNISCFQLCQMFYRGQLCELDFQIFDHGVVVPPPNFPSDLLAIHQVCTDLNLPASDALDRTSWRAVATAATHACATCWRMETNNVYCTTFSLTCLSVRPHGNTVVYYRR